MPNRVMITPLTLYNIDSTIFDDIPIPTYNFPRSIEYDDLFLRVGWELDKQVLIDNILLETAELDTIYTNPAFFKFAVKQWAAKEFPVWQALYETIFYKYNPIWNKDGTIKESERQIRDLLAGSERTKSNSNVTAGQENENITDNDDTERTNNTSKNNVNSKTSSGTEDTTEDGSKTINNENTKINNLIENGNNTLSVDGSETEDTTITNSVSAFDNLTGWTNHDKTVNDTDKTNERSEEGTNNKTTIGNESENGLNEETTDNTINKTINNSENNVNTETSADEENINRDYTRERNNSNNIVNNGTENEFVNNTDTGSIDKDYERKEFGNIGVTTTQAMIEAERNLVKFNIYDFIIDSFKARFCILIY